MTGPQLLGGLVGGALGAAAWVAAAYVTGSEVGFAALGVGAAVGGGVHLASAGRPALLGGLTAAAITLVAVLGGRFGASLCSGGVVCAAERSATLDEEYAISFLADDVIADRERSGACVSWPDGSVPGFAARAADYSEDVWDEASRAWASLPPEERARRIARLPGSARSVEAFHGAGRRGSPVADALFAALAVLLAFRLGTTSVQA